MSNRGNAHVAKQHAEQLVRPGVGTAGTGWIRCTLTAEMLSDAHLGSGSGGSGIDALVARDRYDRPVVWASHVEGVLRDAARRLRGDDAAGSFFGRAGGERQRAVFTSLYSDENFESGIWSRIWRSTARQAFDNRAPRDDTLRVIEYVPKGARFVGYVELPASELPVLQRLVQEVDALGGGRATGAGRVKLTLQETPVSSRKVGDPNERLLLLLKNRDPVCITATATPDNLIPSLAFVPGRALLGAIAAWLIAEGDRETASLLTSGRISMSDALPVPHPPKDIAAAEVLPAPLTLQREKPKGSAGEIPWWAQAQTPTRRMDAWSVEGKEKLKRPEDDLFVYRDGPHAPWTAFRPARRVRLRNGRPKPRQADVSLFAIEQIVEETHFLVELRGALEDMRMLADKLAAVLEGRRWLRLGRGGAPVEVAQVAWARFPAPAMVDHRALLTLTSDLLVRDDLLRWRTALDADALRDLLGVDVQIEKSMQDSITVHGFNGTSRLWRMPAVAIRRGSVFRVSGAGISELAERAVRGSWLGERTHEGFGRFRIDAILPGVNKEESSAVSTATITDAADVDEEEVAATTQRWFNEYKKSFERHGGVREKPPSLSQWFDLVADLERKDPNAIVDRLNPKTAGARSWKYKDAKAILEKLEALEPEQRALHARFFMRWLRAELRRNRDKGSV